MELSQSSYIRRRGEDEGTLNIKDVVDNDGDGDGGIGEMLTIVTVVGHQRN